MNKKNANGALVWITGLPGCGKTTLSKKLYESINNKLFTIRMDGDVFREIMDNDLGYTIEDRKKNAFRLARMNKYLVEHGAVVICATVSLFKEVHDWNRKNINNLLEIFIEVSENVLNERDQKNLYSKGKTGETKNVYGIDQSFDIPKNPDLIIKNDGSLDDFLKNTLKIEDLLKAKYDNLFL
ncbi:MAG: adenylyl-sulfate kinase [Patescibacteria group bacterium]|nr:adenylyl-sulfate kinase [Patescibacteria group bacterium]